jgi:hypothetical protein
MKIILSKIKRRALRLINGTLLFYLAHPWAFGRGVVAGPFNGTRMTIKTTWSSFIYLIVGSYEKELHRIWDNLNSTQCGNIIVIGAAEGYYVCGLAKKWGANVIAFEASEESRRVLMTNIKLNGLQKQVEIFGKCEVADLLNLVKHAAPNLIVCDIEGGEDDMFSEELLSFLKKTVLIIEMHPPYGLQSRIDAIAKTHEVQILNPTDRCLADYPYRDWVPDKIKAQWLNEHRPFSTPWLFAVPQDSEL